MAIIMMICTGHLDFNDDFDDCNDDCNDDDLEVDKDGCIYNCHGHYDEI